MLYRNLEEEVAKIHFDYKDIFSEIKGSKILIYDFEIDDLPFIDFLYKNFPFVMVVTNSFDKYTHALVNVEFAESYFVLHEITDTKILNGNTFDTVIMFNTLTNIRNSVINNVPLKEMQTVSGSVRHMEVMHVSVLKRFIEDVRSLLTDKGKLIIRDFNYVDSDEYGILSVIILNDPQMYVFDTFLSLKINRDIDFNVIKQGEKYTSFAGAYKDVYSFMTTRIRIGTQFKHISEMINENGGITDIPRDSIVLCGTLSAETYKGLLDNVFKFKNTRYKTYLSNDTASFVEQVNFEGLNRLSDVIDDDIMILVSEKG